MSHYTQPRLVNDLRPGELHPRLRESIRQVTGNNLPKDEKGREYYPGTSLFQRLGLAGRYVNHGPREPLLPLADNGYLPRRVTHE